MIKSFTRVGQKLKFLGPVFILGALVAVVVLALVFVNDWSAALYPALTGLLWSLLGLCFIWWFQPPGPNAVLLTTAWGRFKAKITRFFAVLKCWIFIALALGVISLTFRFYFLWQAELALL